MTVERDYIIRGLFIIGFPNMVEMISYNIYL